MNYQKYADKAYEKIKKYGSAIMVRQSGQKEYDPTTNTYVDSGLTIVGVAIQRQYSQRDIDGTNIKMGDVEFMASLNGKPQTNDEIEFEGKKYVVILARALAPDGTTDIFYTIQAR